MANDKRQDFPFLNGDVTKLMGDFKLPNVDIDSVMAVGRRNIEALSEANKLAAEGFQAVARRQAEIVREAVTDFQSTVKDLLANRSAEGLPQRQAELAKKSFEAAVANARELAEITSKANAEVFEVINKRFVESIEEIKALGPKA
jgi:phasin family protein